MTAMMTDGSAPAHATELHRFALPDPAADRYQPTFNGLGQYKGVPHPETGKPSTFTRASTICKVLDDTYPLDKWKLRQVLAGLAQRPDLLTKVTAAIESEARAGVVDAIAEDAQVAAGSAEAREFGTAVHAWAEEVDSGRILPSQVPLQFREHVQAYLVGLARHAITALPEYTERIVYNSRANCMGTLDRIYLLADGTLCLGDVKTSKSLDFTYLSYAIQLDIYAEADWMLSLDGTAWEPMPELRKDFAVLAHVPSQDAALTAMVTYDLAVGSAALDTALLVRELRRTAKKSIPNRHAIPIPDATLARQHAAVLALRTSDTTAALPAVMAEYEDVWTDDLNTLGHAVFESLEENENAR